MHFYSTCKTIQHQKLESIPGMLNNITKFTKKGSRLQDISVFITWKGRNATWHEHPLNIGCR